MYSLSLDIGATKTVLALIDEHGWIARQEKVRSLALLTAHGEPSVSLATSLVQFCDEATIPLTALHGIGIGFPGVMDRSSGIIASCPLLPLLDGCPLASALSRQLGVPKNSCNQSNFSIWVGLRHRLAG